MKAKAATVGVISVGDARVRDVQVLVHTLLRERGAGVRYDGILGHPFLSNFTVTINYSAKMLTLASPVHAE